MRGRAEIANAKAAETFAHFKRHGIDGIEDVPPR
jgi:hypothetical protein